MFKHIIWTIIIILTCHTSVNAQEVEAEACNHKTGDCYEAEVNLPEGIIIIKLGENNYITLDLDDTDANDINAYDETSDIYYDIEILE